MKKDSLALRGVSVLLIAIFLISAMGAQSANAAAGCPQSPYIIALGDTYWGIASACGLSVPQLQLANGSKSLLVGDSIIIPASTAPIPMPPPVAPAAAAYQPSAAVIPPAPILTPTPPTAFAEAGGIKVWSFRGYNISPYQVSTPDAAMAAGLALVAFSGPSIPAWLPVVVGVVVIGVIIYAIVPALIHKAGELIGMSSKKEGGVTLTASVTWINNFSCKGDLQVFFKTQSWNFVEIGKDILCGGKGTALVTILIKKAIDAIIDPEVKNQLWLEYGKMGDRILKGFGFFQ